MPKIVFHPVCPPSTRRPPFPPPTARLSDVDLARAIATAVKALRNEFKAVSAPLAASALAANAEAAAAAASAAATRAPPRGRATLPATAAEARPTGGPPPVTLRVLKPASGGGAAPATPDGGGGAATVTAQPRALPRPRAADKPPPFKAWTYVTRNEAAAQGGRLFYTDAETNETVPVSDSSDDEGDDDDDDASDDDAVAAAAAAAAMAAASPAAALALDGLTRERDAFTMLGVAASFGCGPRVATALADLLDAPDLAKAVGGRLAAAAAWLDARAAEQARADAAAAAEDALPPTTPIETLGRVLCRQCRVYACALHADSSAAVRAARAAVAAAGAGGSGGGTPDGDGPCSDACYRVVGVGGGRERVVAAAAAATGRNGAAAAAAAAPSRRRRAPGLSWTPAETALVTRVVAALGRGDVCAIAAAVPTRTCSAAAAWLAANPDTAAAIRGVKGMVPVAALAAAEAAGGPAASFARGGATALTAGRGRGPPTRGRGRGRGARALANVRKKHDDSLWEPYTPCACGPGGCSPKCACFASKNYCEKFCGCPPSCSYRFKGCVCKGGCKTGQCPCLAALRECNPDICKFCGVAEGASTARAPPRVALAAASAPPALAPTPDPSAGFVECSNMRLRLRQHKRVAAGASSIDGWGAFLLEPARKGDLIGEYCGELVSHAEADRRGKAYDRDDSSYLFNLTSDSVVDARTAGSKLRFANHAPGADANCRPKVVLVDGDSRVGIYASRDLPAGAELTFDYQYEEDRAPAWCTR